MRREDWEEFFNRYKNEEAQRDGAQQSVPTLQRVRLPLLTSEASHRRVRSRVVDRVPQHHPQDPRV